MTFGGASFGDSLFGDGAESAPISNLGFEQGTNGIAALWHVESFTSSPLLFATFAGEKAVETFERGWVNDAYDFSGPAQIAAQFTDAPAPEVEGFERGWSNHPYMRASFPNAVATFSDGTFAERFETAWGNTSWVGAHSAYTLQYPLYSHGSDVEPFEAGWQNVEAYVFELTSSTGATFYGERATTFEGFQHVQEAQAYTADATDDELETTGHGLATDYRVVLASAVAGLMPSPLAPGVPYFVQAVPSADAFKLAPVAGAGSPIDITTAGSGLLKWSAPYENWVTLMVTI